MNETIAAAIAADLATLERVIDPPPEPLGYGGDLDCIIDCTEDYAELDGDTPRGIAQAIARRYCTPRGGLLDDPDYGCDVRGMLNHATTQASLRSLQTRMKNEAAKDERVERADIVVTYDSATSSLSAAGTIVPRDPQRVSFAFVVRVTDSEVLLELLRSGAQGGA